MGSEARHGIPTIDFTKPDLIPSNPEWESVRFQVKKAIEEYGCFQALFPRISPTLQADFFACLKDLFDLPLETKELYASDKPLHGYIPSNRPAVSYEGFAIDRPSMADTVERFTTTLWPQGNSSFSTTLESFVKETSGLAEIIRRMILESMEVEKYLEENMNSTKFVLRVMRYDGSETGEPLSGLPAHIDRNMFTILYQNQIDGLDVLTKDGEWTNVNFLPNSFTVLMGESLNAWTNGRIQTPYHRVMVSKSNVRYSAGLFSQFKEGYMVRAPEELVDDEHPLQYQPFDYSEFENYRFQSKKFTISLKDQYGVHANS